MVKAARSITVGTIYLRFGRWKTSIQWHAGGVGCFFGLLSLLRSDKEGGWLETSTVKELKKENDALKQQVQDLKQDVNAIREPVGSIRSEATMQQDRFTIL